MITQAKWRGGGEQSHCRKVALEDSVSDLCISNDIRIASIHYCADDHSDTSTGHDDAAWPRQRFKEVTKKWEQIGLRQFSLRSRAIQLSQRTTLSRLESIKLSPSFKNLTNNSLSLAHRLK